MKFVNSVVMFCLHLQFMFLLMYFQSGMMFHNPGSGKIMHWESTIWLPPQG